MLILLNTTKTMDFSASGLPNMATSNPGFQKTAQRLAGMISKMTQPQLAELMVISDKLAAETHAKFSLWGKAGSLKVPALFGFTGIIYKHLDAPGLNKNQLTFARKHVRILSGLYGLLEPFDLIEDYRLEMGCKLKVGNYSSLAHFWKDELTAKLSGELASGEPIVSVASQEYMKALDIKKLDHPVIMPAFKEQRADGSFKNSVVHAKKARGAMIRYAIKSRAKSPNDLMGFSEMGWKAAQPPPENGSWLFTRPAE